MRSIKSVLEKRRQSLRRAIDSTLDSTRDGGGDVDVSKDPMGAAAVTHDREIAVAVADRRARELQLVTSALESIEAGGYGTCRTCGSTIPSARLKVIPFATRCVPCQAALESAGGTS
jgi:RNA polymerase-binding protein DksA